MTSSLPELATPTISSTGLPEVTADQIMAFCPAATDPAAHLAATVGTGLIERRQGKLGSKSVFAGTHIPVETVVRLHSAGWDLKRILDNYPGLTAVDVKVTLVEAG
ncbi:MAG: DUF433 domain-containing protein [Acidimicrobiales bacterium]